MSVNITDVWEKYGLGEVEDKLAGIFPESGFSLEEMFAKILSGDVLGAFLMPCNLHWEGFWQKYHH